MLPFLISQYLLCQNVIFLATTEVVASRLTHQCALKKQNTQFKVQTLADIHCMVVPLSEMMNHISWSSRSFWVSSKIQKASPKICLFFVRKGIIQ